MSEWNKDATLLRNGEDVYEKLCAKMGVNNIQHCGRITFGSPLNEEFRQDLQKREHIFSIGDRLSKLAFQYYGDAKLWWVLAWYNGKPTDHHCRVGDIIEVPFPLEEVLFQAYNGELT